MSCFIVPDFHINAIVSWAARKGYLAGWSADAVAHELATANRRAFSERYAGRHDSELVPFGGFDPVPELSPVAIVKACDCLDYQACDWSAWADSRPRQVLDLVRMAAIAHAAGLADHDKAARLSGYQAAAWCLDSEPELAGGAA